MRMLARSPAGIRNVRYARSRSNLFCDFVAPFAPWFWKFAYSTPEKSTGMDTVGLGGGAGLVVSAGCWAASASGAASATIIPNVVVRFTGPLRREHWRPE